MQSEVKEQEGNEKEYYNSCFQIELNMFQTIDVTNLTWPIVATGERFWKIICCCTKQGSS